MKPFRPVLHRRLRQRQQGVLLVPMLLLIVPLLLLWIFVISLARHQMLDTRAHQAQIQAVLALARYDALLDERQRLAMANAYISNNTISNDMREHTLVQSGTTDEKQLRTEYRWRPWFHRNASDNVEAMSRLGHSGIEVRAQRFIRPLEIVVVVDASGSLQKHDIDEVRTGMTRYINHFFRNQDTARDVWISLVSYSAMVNLGWKYRDALITPRSRKIPAELEAVAREHDWWNENDLLHANGIEGWRRGACVQRPDINSVADYIRRIQIPPDISENGFDLVVAREFASREANKQRRILGHGDSLFWNENVEDEAFRQFYWLRGNTRHLQTPSGTVSKERPRVGTSLDCGHMPILVASHNRNELIQHLRQYYPTVRTGGDEGLAWGFRMLAPQWQSIWRTGTAPHAYNAGVEKKLVWISDGENNLGYTERNPALNIVPQLCSTMRQHGIEISSIAFGDIIPVAPSVAQMSDCTSNAETRFFTRKTSAGVAADLLELSARQFRVRLIAPT